MGHELSSAAVASRMQALHSLSVRPRNAKRGSACWGLESAIAVTITRAVRLLTGIRPRWLGCGPTDTQRIYFANHASHLDAVLLWSALPPQLRRKTRPVAANDYWQKSPLRRYLVEGVFRGVFVDRERRDPSANSIAPLLDALDNGDSLIVFPEGTRGSGEELQPFKSGIFRVACQRPTVEFVPVWLDNSYRVMPKGAILPLPLLCTASFGPPSRIENSEDKASFLDRLRKSLLEVGKL